MTCKDCIHSGVCYKKNDYENFPDRCGEFISDKVLEERPQGKWILGKSDSGNYLKCPKCNFIEWQNLSAKYCSNCGADLRENNKETTFDDYLKEQLKDPEFRKEWEKLFDEVKKNEQRD